MTASPSQPRWRRRRDSHSGVRCRMCGQTVVVDAKGRCLLGHQVIPPGELAEADRSEPPTDTPVQDPDAVHVEVAEDDSDPPAESPSLAPMDSEPTAGPPSLNRLVPTPAQIRRREMTSFWVPGLPAATIHLDSPAYEADPRADRRPAPAEDRPLPVMEDTPPPPVPADPDPLPPPPVTHPEPPADVGPPAAAESGLDHADDPSGTQPAPPPPSPGSALAGRSDMRVSWSLDDLQPAVSSALDITDLPEVRPRPERTYEQAPLDEDASTRKAWPRWLGR